MTSTSTTHLTHDLRLPGWVWFGALLAGVLLAVGSLSYTPDGRINVLWLWLLWAGLPLLGFVVSLWVALFGRSRPWLFQWRHKAYQWYPSPHQRWYMLCLLQGLWAVVGLGILLGFWLLLLLTDLAFGWSSTLLADDQYLLRIIRALALPWSALWPAAVPDAALLEATRFVRIDNAAAPVARVGDWWRFMMASLLCYNLAPRLVLGAALYGRWRVADRQRLQVNGPASKAGRDAENPILVEADQSEWRDALPVFWELEQDNAANCFGLNSWEEDDRAFTTLLASSPHSVLWQVNVNRSPVAELSDLILKARTAGVTQQALLAKPNAGTDPTRHLASWRAFARRQNLVWITPDA